MARPMFYYPQMAPSGVARRELTLFIDVQQQGDARPFALDARKVPLGDFEDDGTVIGVRHTDYTRRGKPKSHDFEYTMPEPEVPDPDGTIGPDDEEESPDEEPEPEPTPKPAA